LDLYTLAPEAQLVMNSAFPSGSNDGAVWSGRGLTAIASAGFAGTAGPLSIVVQPIAFRAENRAFVLMPNGQTGRLQFADGLRPTTIDQPQRFGDGAYTRIDPGQTTLRLDFPIIAAGVSTANQQWGPAIEYPLILGNNAAGFPHAFISTPGRIDLWLFKLNARTEAGRLDQSPYSVVEGTNSRRLMTGMVVALTPRGLDNLEIGGARFFHSLWPQNGLQPEAVLRPVHGFFGSGQNDADNQIAALFVRSVFPSSGLEVYGEFGREDRSGDLRDLTLEPDHEAGYVIGFQKTWSPAPERLFVLRGEVLNTRITHLELARPEPPFYVHFPIRQGHTERGQVLGAVGGYGGGASNVAFDRYDRRGKWSFEWERVMVAEHVTDEDPPNPRAADVTHSLSVSRTFFRRSGDVVAGLTATRELNRQFAGDATNLRAQLGFRPRW
jgi:hypothetical protein